MTTPLQNNFFSDKLNYEITICVISDYWGEFKKLNIHIIYI